MSTSGQIRFSRPRPNAARICSEIVAQCARELLPASKDAVDFYAEGFRDFVFGDITHSKLAFRQKVLQQGALQLDVLSDDVAATYENLRQEVLQRAGALNISVPSSIVTTPTVVTAGAVKALEIARDELSKAVHEDGGKAYDLTVTASTIAGEELRAQKAFDTACMVMGLASARRADHPIFQSIRQLIDSPVRSPEIGDAVDVMFREQQARVDGDAEDAWSAILLAASTKAFEQAELQSTGCSLAERRATATDPNNPERRLDVWVDPRSGKLRYELFGYVGGACKPVQSKFLNALEELLGVDMSSAATEVDKQDTRSDRPSTGTRLAHDVPSSKKKGKVKT
ncbi:MAG: hypothetical protein Q7R48_04050 [bacterium]|nr:hypothetical protein [bacterium]